MTARRTTTALALAAAALVPTAATAAPARPTGTAGARLVCLPVVR